MSLTRGAPSLTTTTAANSLTYRAYVDGLRAIAVLAVLFYHAEVGCNGGYIGVDIFFVISGYLITGLILKDIDGGQFHILRFWERRILRIFPALAVIVLSCLAIGWILLLPKDFAELGKSAAAQALILSNVYFWREISYFTNNTTSPLLHTWSLAVEEQFYLLFPGLLFLLSRFSRKCLMPAILLVCTLSFCLSVYWSYVSPDANYYLPFTRAWELGIGALLAIIPSKGATTKWMAESLSWAGLLSILCAMFFYNARTRFPGAAALLPCVGTFLIIWANGRSLSSVGRLLATRPMVFVGLISYSLYLWHWPLFVFARYSTFNPSPLGVRIVILLTSLIPAFLSWKYVETPFRKRTILRSREQIFSFARITTLVLLLSGLTVYCLHGLPSRFSPAVMQYANGTKDRAFLDEVSLKDALAGRFIEIGSRDKHKPIDVLVWGDSHAMAVMPVLDRLCREHSVRGVAATHSATCPAIGYESNDPYSLGKSSIPFNNTVVEFIRGKHVRNVVLAARWKFYLRDDGDATRVHRGLINTIDALKDTGARIWIMRQVPEQCCDRVPAALAVSVRFHCGDPENFGITLAEHRESERKTNPVFEGLAELPRVAVMDPAYLLAKHDGICHVAKNGRSLYADDSHLTTTGAMELRPLFAPLFKAESLRDSQ